MDDAPGTRWQMTAGFSIALLLALVVLLGGATLLIDEPPFGDWVTLAIGGAVWWLVFTVLLATEMPRVCTGVALVLVAIAATQVWLSDPPASASSWGRFSTSQPGDWPVAVVAGVTMALAMGWLVIKNRASDGLLAYLVGGELLLIGIGFALMLVLSSPTNASSRFPNVGSDCGPTSGEGCLGRPRRRRGRVVPARDMPGPPTSVHDLWARAAVDEHHSVEAFETLAERLRAVGAPDALVERSLDAAHDEVRHAEVCRRFAGVRTAPCRTPVSRPMRTRTHIARRAEVVRLAVESYVDGVVGEGIGAELLRHGADTAPPRRRSHLTRMAADEQRHAELGADIVTWARTTSPRLVRAALLASDRGMHRQRENLRSAPLPDETLHLAGLVPPRIARDVAEQHRDRSSAWLRSAVT